jgi:hypothetical protein
VVGSGTLAAFVVVAAVSRFVASWKLVAFSDPPALALLRATLLKLSAGFRFAGMPKKFVASWNVLYRLKPEPVGLKLI